MRVEVQSVYGRSNEFPSPRNALIHASPRTLMIVSGVQLHDEPSEGEVRRLAVRGELDAHAAVGLQAALEREIRDSDRVVHLVLDGLEFIDSAGLRALVDIDRRLRADGRQLVLEKPTDSVHHVLRVAELDGHFEIVLA